VSVLAENTVGRRAVQAACHARAMTDLLIMREVLGRVAWDPSLVVAGAEQSW
jgi:hypothetical protein